MKKLLCLVLALGFRSGFGADEEKNPVSRVVGLLGDLKTRIEKDGKTEQKTFDKFACWCEQTTGKTASTITSVKEQLKTTGNMILKLRGSVAMRSSEIKGLAEDITTNQNQQGEQTSIREKENASFMAEKAELESALSALEKGITVLKAATHGSAFVQTTQWASTVSEVVSKMSVASLGMKLSEKQLVGLSQLSGKSAGAYAPQSATIQGILSDMYTTFSKNLQTGTGDEAKSHRNYEALMATYQKQLNTLQESLVKKQQRKTEDEVQLADSMQSYTDSEEQLKSEIKLFDATKGSCTKKTSAWSKRSALRTTELEGISKALAILSSDESKELFSKSIKPGFSKGGAAAFIQVSSDFVTGTGTQKAINALETHARQTNSFRLAALAAEVRMGGHFDKVLKTIGSLLVQLEKEEDADIKKVDGCKDNYQEINKKKGKLDWKIENNQAKVQTHEKAVSQKDDKKTVTVKDIETAGKMLTDMEKKRKAENDEYKQSKSDDEKAIVLLQKAKGALASYYKKNLLQVDAEPDMKLSENDSAEGQANGVLSLLDMIIEDLNGELAESKSAEASAQLDYEKMTKAVQTQKAKLTRSKINLEGQIAEERSAKNAEKNLQKENEKELKNQKTTEADLKKTCDDAIKLQPERREKRKVESDGLKQARDFLSGMQADALVQTAGHKSEKEVFPTFGSLSFLQRM